MANLQSGVGEMEGNFRAWITPLLQIGLGGLLFAHTVLRCRKMRD